MKLYGITWKLLPLAAALLLAQEISLYLFKSPNSLYEMGYQYISNILILIVLLIYYTSSHLSNLKRLFAVGTILWVIGTFNILIEAFVFNITERSATLIEMGSGLLTTAIFIPVWYVLVKPPVVESGTRENRSVIKWIMKIIGVDFLYLFFYITAGMMLSILAPAIMEFYSGKLPEIGEMILTQLLIRGILFAAITILIVETTNLSRWKSALLTGFAFSILGGIAPLIPPNELMPVYVRMGHGIEVGISNILFGMVASLILFRKYSDN